VLADEQSMSAPREAGNTHWLFRVFYDAECPLCRREIAMIQRLDRGRGRVDCVDLSDPTFDAGAFGLEQASIEARIHGQRPDGEIVEGVDVFIHLYDAVGWGWLTAPARWPGLRRILDRLYLWFARNRLKWTGRAPRTCDASGGDSGCGTSPRAPQQTRRA
jgi:predicted DCC family thiol-disulfide oxidoreductase YuxK